MTFGRTAFSPSSYNPRIPAPQRVAGPGDNAPRTDGSGSPATSPPLKPHNVPTGSPRFTRTRRRAGTRDRTHPGSPGRGAAEPRWHLLLGSSPKDGAQPPLWGPATPLARRQAIRGGFQQAHLLCRQQRAGNPEETVTVKSEMSLFVVSPSRRLKRKNIFGCAPAPPLERTERRG